MSGSTGRNAAFDDRTQGPVWGRYCQSSFNTSTRSNARRSAWFETRT